ncbi:MAG: molecular chaperone HtpG [Clostridia bacterium]|nr:molecular chaperone HtpG [Clostridia bacterium]
MESNTTRGGISIELEHIFPIIKKWLYSEKEIFLREIVSNACDAITKLRRLVSLGEAGGIELGEQKIRVILDEKASTITVTDTGIGMTEEELKKYICQIALSGALDFIQKYEGTEADPQQNGIIGHFGLGFYSSFMVSDTVDVITRSYTGSPVIKWTCTDEGNYEITPDYDDEEGLVGSFGTAVVMHINDEGKEFLSPWKLRDVLEKYCAFMPEEIYFEEAGKEEEKKDKKDKDKEPEAPKPVNDTHPLWLKNPSDCTDEEYKEFYRKVFKDWKEPLFHIHLKADYPLNFKGILYFPRIGSEFESLEGQVKLYYNQVFVADNIKEVIPEYLLMLKGVLDCPELPLNVSRSYLQNSGYVSKISAHITKKVADKLNSMFTQDRKSYEGIWRDLKTFVEYGCLRDQKFYDRVKDTILLEQTGGEFKTIDEYLESAKEKHENKIYYANDKVAQSGYIRMFNDQGIDIVLLDRIIDSQFINVIEQNREGVKFVRVDSEIADDLKGDGEIKELPKVAELLKKVAGEKLTVKFDRLKDEKIPAILNVSEEGRRMNDMMAMYRMDGMPLDETLIMNLSSPLTGKLADEIENGREEAAETMARQIYRLAALSQRQLTSEELVDFLSDSYKILGMIN